MSKPSLFEQYVAKKAEIESAQEAVKVAQVASRDILRQILTASGKGPHDIGGKSSLIVDRNGTLCLMPALRPKGSVKPKAEPKEPKAAAAPKAPKAPKKGAKTAEVTV